MTTLSSEFRAQSTIPFLPLMGKLISVRTDAAGSFWMLATIKKKEKKSSKILVLVVKVFYYGLIKKSTCISEFWLQKEEFYRKLKKNKNCNPTLVDSEVGSLNTYNYFLVCIKTRKMTSLGMTNRLWVQHCEFYSLTCQLDSES